MICVLHLMKEAELVAVCDYGLKFQIVCYTILYSVFLIVMFMYSCYTVYTLLCIFCFHRANIWESSYEVI